VLGIPIKPFVLDLDQIAASTRWVMAIEKVLLIVLNGIASKVDVGSPSESC